ncbi:MAG: hypothetical protein AAF160_12535 [Pseudomonadota bacterium]
MAVVQDGVRGLGNGAASSLPPGLAALAAGRVHEVCGSGRLAFALAMAGEARGPVLWIAEATRRDRPCPHGIARFLDPARLVLARPTGLIAALQVMEEALRSGAAPLVLAELEAAPDLTQSRRLQLAAGTGGGWGLCLVPENRLATNAAETRWRCRPLAAPGTAGTGEERRAADAHGAQEDWRPTGALQLWELVKNKRGALGAWEVSLNAATEIGRGRSVGRAAPTVTDPAAAGLAARHGADPRGGGVTPIGSIRAIGAIGSMGA